MSGNNVNRMQLGSQFEDYSKSINSGAKLFEKKYFLNV